MRAETLRDGIKCSVNIPSANQPYFNFDVLGGCNYHGSIVFEDGKTWLARFRLPNHNEPPLQERNFDGRSEFATYCFLAGTAIPVPEVYECADDDDPMNLVGAGYILLEKLAEKPLAWHEASKVQRGNFSRQLAEIYTNLEQYPLNGLGRLQLSSMGLPGAGLAFFDYDSSGNLNPFSPFSHSNDYYTALIQQKIQLIKTGEIASSVPLDQNLVYLSLLDSLPPNESCPIFLRHMDSSDANFLVDDDYNITGIIDWELAIITSKGSAFQSPLLMYNLGELYDDEQRLSKILREEKWAVELSASAEQKLHLRVDQVIETDPWDRRNFASLFSGRWKVTNGGKHSTGIRGTSRHLTSMAMEAYENRWGFSCLHALVQNQTAFHFFSKYKTVVHYLKLLQQAEVKRRGLVASDCPEDDLQPQLRAWYPFDLGY